MKIAERLASVRQLVADRRVERDAAAAHLADLEERRRALLREGQVDDARALATSITDARLALSTAIDPELEALTAVESELAGEAQRAAMQEREAELVERAETCRATILERDRAAVEAIRSANALLAEAAAIEASYAAGQAELRTLQTGLYDRSIVAGTANIVGDLPHRGLLGEVPFLNDVQHWRNADRAVLLIERAAQRRPLRTLAESA